MMLDRPSKARFETTTEMVRYQVDRRVHPHVFFFFFVDFPSTNIVLGDGKQLYSWAIVEVSGEDGDRSDAEATQVPSK